MNFNNIYKIKKYIFSAIVLFLFARTEHIVAQSFRVPGGRQNQMSNDRSSFNSSTIDNSAGMHKIDEIKTGYLSDNMNLTSDEAEKFWPLYKQYQNEMNVVLHQKRQNILNSKRDAQDIVNDNFEYDSKILSIKKKYNDDFSKVLPSDKLMHFWKGERTFNEMMINRLKRGRNND